LQVLRSQLPAGFGAEHRVSAARSEKPLSLLTRRTEGMVAPSSPDQEFSRPALHVVAESDGELLGRIDDDLIAIEALYRRYARALFALALRRLRDPGRAEDAVQEAFIAVWRSAARYRPDRGPGAPWLYAIARNAIIDSARASTRAHVFNRQASFPRSRRPIPPPTSLSRTVGPPSVSMPR
jgi:hypothetical protein